MAESKTSIYDVVGLKNITGHAINPGDITWDSKDIIKIVWQPGERRNFVRFEANHILKKMIDERIVRSAAGIKNLKDKKIRGEFEKEALVEDVISGITSNVVGNEVAPIPVVQEIKEDSLGGEKMSVLKAKAKELGIDFKFGISKLDLIEKIRNAKAA